MAWEYYQVYIISPCMLTHRPQGSRHTAVQRTGHLQAGPEPQHGQVNGVDCSEPLACYSLKAQLTRAPFQHTESCFCLQSTFIAPFPHRGKSIPPSSSQCVAGGLAWDGAPACQTGVLTAVACSHPACRAPESPSESRARAILSHWFSLKKP